MDGLGNNSLGCYSMAHKFASVVNSYRSYVFAPGSHCSALRFMEPHTAQNVFHKVNWNFWFFDYRNKHKEAPFLERKTLDDGWPESEERCSEICIRKSEDGIAWSIKREIYQDISEKKRYKKWYIRCEDMKRWRCKMRKKILKMWRGEDVKRRRCYDMKIWGYDVERWAREDLGFDGGVKIWRDGDVRMRKKDIEDVKRWGCEEVKMWACEDVRMKM